MNILLHHWCLPGLHLFSFFLELHTRVLNQGSWDPLELTHTPRGLCATKVDSEPLMGSAGPHPSLGQTHIFRECRWYPCAAVCVCSEHTYT